MKCIRNHEIIIMKSAAGFYLGSRQDGMPYCRISGYYSSPAEAEKALAQREVRVCSENLYCSGGRNCLGGN